MKIGTCDLKLSITKMKKLTYIFFLLLLVVSCQSDELSIAYVQNMKLYAEFDLAKELDNELQAFSKNRTNELDSLTLIFENMTADFERMNEIPAQAYQSYNDLRNAILFREKNYEEELLALSQEYDRQIWERINNYVKDYAEENNYDMVLGANGNGNLMFATDTLDITDELIQYCNTNYNGEK